MNEIKPKYDLEEIHGLIRDGNLNINYGGRSEIESTNLDYVDEDVEQCLLSLTNNDYVGTREYVHGQKTVLCDVYEIDYVRPDNCTDELYIKFKYGSNWLTLISFHLRRYG